MLILTLQGLPGIGLKSYGQTDVPASDTLKEPVSSAIVSDTSKITDSVSTAKGDIETAISYSAKDSIRMDVVKKLVYLYGNAKIDYGNISITAGEIEINWETNIFTARPVRDSTGKIVQTPVLTENGDMYQIDTLRYNFKTRKGLISGVVFKQDESFIHGEKVKKAGDNMYISDAKYTTCNLAHPHFYVNAHKLKVIPDDKVVSGPFNLVIADVPTPVGFFLGFFPFPRKEKSGFIIPTFGSSARGFFLREGGYYWAVNEHLGLRAVGDVYGNGSVNSMTTADYIKRYKFSGNFSFRYSRTKLGFENDSIDPFIPTFNIAWSHRTLSKRNSNFTASVNAGSNGYYKRNSYNPTLFQQGLFSSSLIYYKSFANTPFNLNVSLRQDQNIQTKVMNFTLPDMTLAMNRIYPFKRKKAAGAPTWYENISITYTGNARVFITNDSARIGLDSTPDFNYKNLGLLLEKAEYGAKHTIPVYTTIKFNRSFLKYFNFSPSFQYNEYWYPYKLRYSLDRQTNRLITERDYGFSRAFDYTTGMSVSTTIYGQYAFKGSKKLMGMRHTIVPNVSYAYKPDFEKGNYQTLDIDTINHEATISHYQGLSFGGPSQGLVSGLNFNINNSLEGKGFVKRDSSGKPIKYMIVEQFNISGSYNFASKQQKFSPLVANFRTRVWNGRIDLNAGSVFDPYEYDRDTTFPAAQNRFIRTERVSIAQGVITSYNFSIGLTLAPGKNKIKKPKDNTVSEEDRNYINAHPEQFVDFNLPWNLFVRYILNTSRFPGREDITSQNISFNGDIRLTPKWMITFNSGYDVKEKKLASTRVDISRDLHCWQMAMNIVPFGQFRSYSFTISAKSAILRDLKVNKRNATFYGTYY